MRWFLTGRFAFLVLAVLFSSVLCGGCGDDDEEEETIAGLQERNRVLLAEIEYLKSRIEELRHDNSVKLSDTESEKNDVELQLSQLKKSNDELMAARDLGERLTALSSNMQLYSLFVSILVNVVLIAWVAWDYRNRKRTWDYANQFITAKIDRYVNEEAANDEQ